MSATPGYDNPSASEVTTCNGPVTVLEMKSDISVKFKFRHTRLLTFLDVSLTRLLTAKGLRSRHRGLDLAQALGRLVPVHQVVHEGGDVTRAQVLVVQVVGVLLRTHTNRFSPNRFFRIEQRHRPRW